MDQTIINWILSVVLFLFGTIGGLVMFIIRQVHSNVKDLQASDKDIEKKIGLVVDDISSIKVLVAGDYVKKSELDGKVDAIFTKLDRIEDKIDKKADKPNKSACDH